MRKGIIGSKNILGILLVLLVGCNSGGHTSNTAADNPDLNSERLIPQNVIDYLSTHLPGYSIANRSDYTTGWWSFYEPQSTPFVVKTDINDDQIVDYALILKKSNLIELVILTGTKGSFKHWIAPDFNKNFNPNAKDLHYGLMPQPPGQIDIAYPQIKSLILKSNAINLMDYENRMAIYYWSGDRIEIFKTH
ncbi:MAG: hypothetical protein H7Y07_01595 [Pyrinomonadaceae bacterium]|nr:hypothetical protein [Sphingobacteriaceae bacterium]